jgi:hypothetical protein
MSQAMKNFSMEGVTMEIFGPDNYELSTRGDTVEEMLEQAQVVKTNENGHEVADDLGNLGAEFQRVGELIIRRHVLLSQLADLKAIHAEFLLSDAAIYGPATKTLEGFIEFVERILKNL